MLKFCVKGDSSADPFYSSSLIIDGLNEGAKKAGIYDEKGKTVVYSTTCNDYGHHADALLCVYETVFPIPILQQANGRPIIGCSLDNLFFITDAYPSSLAGYSILGVDTNKFKPIKRTGNREKFRFLCLAESNARSGIEILLRAFAQTFSDRPGVELYLKDRGATDNFKTVVAEFAKVNHVNIIHDCENTQSFDAVKKLYSESDCHVFVSRVTTWGMSLLESMSMGLPIISVPYAGPAEYLRDGFNGLAVKYEIEEIRQEHLDNLTAFGFRNHMFPLSTYPKKPYWAKPNIESLMEAMSWMFSLTKEQLNYMSRNAIITANQFTWEKAAVNLSYQLSLLDSNKTNPNLNHFNRYE